MNLKPFKLAFALTVLAGLLAIAVFGFLNVNSAEAEEAPKVYVCKYTNTPDGGEELQTGNNPILVSSNAIDGWDGTTIPFPFNDGQASSVISALRQWILSQP